MILWQQMSEIKNLIIYLITTMNIETIQANEAYGNLSNTQFQARGKLDLAVERSRTHF